MTPLLDTTLVTLYSPLSRSASQVGLELVVLGASVATLLHALRARRRDDPAALFTWVAILLYGIAMEVVSYHFVDNFTHAQFTVMLYHKKLPLYVTALYPVLLYTGIAAARRLALPRAIEPVTAGLFIVAMDVPFDIVGPIAGWWTWSDTDPNLAARWLGVPVTSYFWHLTFGGSLAALGRLLGPRTPEHGRLRYLAALPVALLTMVAGFVAFLPFHGLKRVGVPDGAVVGGALVLAAALTLLARRGASGRLWRALGADPLERSVPAAFFGYHVLVAIGMALGRGSG